MHTNKKNLKNEIETSPGVLVEMLKQRSESIWVIDLQFNYIFFNDRYKETLKNENGIEPKIGLNAIGVLKTDDQKEFWRKQYRACTSGHNHSFEYSDEADHQLRYYKVNLCPFISDGKIHGISAFSIDITSLKEAEKRSTTISNILEDSINEIYIFDASTYKFIYANKGALTNIGYKKSEIYELTPLDIKPQLDKRRFDEIVKPLKNRELKSITFETTHQRKDKSLYPVEVHLQLTRLHGIDVFVAFILDLTEKKRIENEIRETQIQYEKLIDQAGDAIFLADFDTANIIYCNKQATRVLGYSKDELLQMKVSELDPNFVKDDHRRKLWNKFKPGKTMTLEVVHKRKDGSLLPVEVRTGVITFKGKKAVLGFSRDITDRKKQEKELIDYRENLEKLVAERTADLAKSRTALVNIIEDITETSDKLRKANAHLDTVNKELETFTYSVSHDLKAPIRAISGFSYLLRQNLMDSLAEKPLKYLNNIEANALNMSKLIEDLLRFSKLNKLEFSAQPVDIQQLFSKAFEQLSTIDDKSKVLFDLKPLPSCRGDEAMLKQVVVNLLSNALKFSARNPNPKISVDGFITKQVVQYSVTDNGVGFDMTYANKLFGVFQRLHSHEEFEGTGVGLAIVQKIIHRHGGEIWAQSELNKGASFYFTLPVKPK